jgi:uncharacterized protein (DUF1778 family)
MPKQKEDRLSIRTDATQKSVLARAASARNMNVSQFVLQASLREAKQVIEEEAIVPVPADEYEWLARIMDEATPTKRLRDAVGKPPIWDV